MMDYTKLAEILRMEREDIENNLKVLSHIVDDDFIIIVDEARKIIRIDKETIEALQAEVKRLKDSNEELREKQTYIDHYGTEWLTSAKDVPNYAYEHGYADGMAEVKAQLAKRGEWVKNEEKYGWHCSCCKVDNRYAYSWNSETMKNEIQDNYCPNCGAKMEAQDGK